MPLLDLAQAILEAFGDFQTAIVYGVTDTWRGDAAFNRPKFIALWTRLCGRIVAIGNWELHIDNRKATRGAGKIVIRQ